MSYWRKGEGLEVIEIVARWLIEQSALRGLTLHDYVDGLCSLADLGATTADASATLKSRIPNAHLHYNEFGGSAVKFTTWENWFSARVRNRIYYFFHRHTNEGRLAKTWAEWPLPIPERATMRPRLYSKLDRSWGSGQRDLTLWLSDSVGQLQRYRLAQ
jgi:hypothetical protein